MYNYDDNVQLSFLCGFFGKRECMVEPIIINGQILGMTFSDDLKWNKPIGIAVLKASKRLYLLKQLPRAGVEKKHLIGFYNACIRSILEYACEVFHSSLPTHLSDDLERVQRRAIRIIFPGMRYREAFETGKFTVTI